MNRKLREVGFAARGLDEAAICQVASDDSDGFISEQTVEVLAVAHGEKGWRRLVDRLVKVGRWENAGGGWLVHDYEEFNYTRAYWEEEKQKKRRAGQQGGKARAKAAAQAPAPAAGLADAQANAQAASLRFATSLSGLLPTKAGGDTAGDEDEPIDQALQALAERDLERRVETKGPVGDPQRWLARAVNTRRERHADLLESLAGLTVDDIINRLEPPPISDEDPDAQLAQAAAENRRRQALPDCADCDNTGFVGADPANPKCACGRLMNASERAQAGAR